MEKPLKPYVENSAPFVFISYSHMDSADVYADLRLFSKRKIRFWFDEGIPPGPEWDETVRKVIQSPYCSGAIFYLSAASVRSEAVQKEIAFLKEKLSMWNADYTPYFAVLLGSTSFDGLMLDTFRDDNRDFYRITQTLFSLFSDKSKYVTRSEAQGSLNTYYDSVLKGLDVFSARDTLCSDIRLIACIDEELGGVSAAPEPGCKDSTVILPDTVNGYSIVKLADDAFADSKELFCIEIPYGVKVIGDRAFRGCTALRSVTIPSGVTSIGASAFEGCTSLDSIELPAALTDIGKSAFKNCSKLEQIALPDGLRALPASVFRGCRSLRTVQLGSGLEQIGIEAFCGCSSLIDLTLPCSLRRIGREAFMSCSSIKAAVIPHSLRDIGEGAFFACTSLESAVLPDSITFLPARCFSECKSLTDIRFPAGCTDVSEAAFAGCTSLVDLHLPASLSDIHDRAFAGCEALCGLQFPDGLQRIGKLSFMGCRSLTHIDIPKWLERIGAMAFSNCRSVSGFTAEGNLFGYTVIGQDLYAGSGTVLVQCVLHCDSRVFELPDGVVTVSPGAFAGSPYESVALPYSLREIGRYAFFDMPFIKSISIPEGVTRIGNGCFSHCASLESIAFPSTAEHIGSSVFRECPSLKYIECRRRSSPTSLGLNCFGGSPLLESITVPQDCAQLYKQLRGWEDRSSLIREAEENE